AACSHLSCGDAEGRTMRRGTTTLLSAVTAAMAVLGAGCMGTGGDEYYQAYLAAEAEIESLGVQLDSTLIRINDLEAAVAATQRELTSAEASVTEAQLNATRDPGSAEFHALQAREGVARARSLLESVAP